jgi:hypothetical protein
LHLGYRASLASISLTLELHALVKGFSTKRAKDQISVPLLLRRCLLPQLRRGDDDLGLYPCPSTGLDARLKSDSMIAWTSRSCRLSSMQQGTLSCLFIVAYLCVASNGDAAVLLWNVLALGVEVVLKSCRVKARQYMPSWVALHMQASQSQRQTSLVTWGERQQRYSAHKLVFVLPL